MGGRGGVDGGRAVITSGRGVDFPAIVGLLLPVLFAID